MRRLTGIFLTAFLSVCVTSESRAQYFDFGGQQQQNWSLQNQNGGCPGGSQPQQAWGPNGWAPAGCQALQQPQYQQPYPQQYRQPYRDPYQQQYQQQYQQPYYAPYGVPQYGVPNTYYRQPAPGGFVPGLGESVQRERELQEPRVGRGIGSTRDERHRSREQERSLR